MEVWTVACIHFRKWLKIEPQMSFLMNLMTPFQSPSPQRQSVQMMIRVKTVTLPVHLHEVTKSGQAWKEWRECWEWRWCGVNNKQFRKRSNSNCESGSSTIDVESGLHTELVTNFSCSVPFTLSPHKTAVVVAILYGYVSFNGKRITSPSDLNSLQGDNMVEHNYLTNFIVDTYRRYSLISRDPKLFHISSC